MRNEVFREIYRFRTDIVVYIEQLFKKIEVLFILFQKSIGNEFYTLKYNITFSLLMHPIQVIITFFYHNNDEKNCLYKSLNNNTLTFEMKIDEKEIESIHSAVQIKLSDLI